MASSEKGNAAIKALDNKAMEGRNMPVSVAKERSERQGGYSNKW